MLTTINILCEIFQGIITYYFFSKELTARFSAKVQITLFTIFFVVEESTHLFSVPILKTIFIIFFFTLIFALLYTDSLKSKIIVLIFLMVFQTASEIITYAVLFYIVADKQSVEFYLLGSVVSKLLQGIFLSILVHTLNLKKRFIVSIKYSFASLLIPAFSIVMIIMFYYSKKSISLYDIFSIFILLVIDVLSIVFFNYTQEIIYLDSNNKLLQQEKSAYLYQCNATRKQWEELRSFRHDTKNSYITDLALLKNGEYEKLQKNFESRLKTIVETKLYSFSHNLELDALINYKGALLESIGSEFICDTNILRLSDEDTDNMTIIIGNLLDNAIEALSDPALTHRRCTLEITCGMPNLTIDISNNYSGKRHKSKGNHYHTTKDDFQNHGIGLKSIERMVESYNGVLIIEDEDNIFHVTIHLYINFI